MSRVGGHTYQNDKRKKLILNTQDNTPAGMCSKVRSEISPDYARNFICDFIIGKEQKDKQLSLFENEQD